IELLFHGWSWVILALTVRRGHKSPSAWPGGGGGGGEGACPCTPEPPRHRGAAGARGGGRGPARDNRAGGPSDVPRRRDDGVELEFEEALPAIISGGLTAPGGPLLQDLACPRKRSVPQQRATHPHASPGWARRQSAFLNDCRVVVDSAIKSPPFWRVVRTCLTMLPGTSSASHNLNSICSPSGPLRVPASVLHFMSLPSTFTVSSPVLPPSARRMRSKCDFFTLAG